MSETNATPRTGVAVITMHEGKVLIGRSTKEPIVGKWVIPGGGIQPFEHMTDTAIREVFEETGLAIEPQHVIFVSEVIKPETQEHRVIIYMYGKYVSGEIKAGGDLSEVQWVDVRELGKYQEDMTDVTIDAFYKFSMILRQQAARQGVQA